MRVLPLAPERKQWSEADAIRQELDAKDPDNPSLSILHFERYTLDLAANASPPGERSPKPKEQYVHELLDPPASLSEGGI